MTDKEPARYYDWMLWKMRQEDAQRKKEQEDAEFAKRWEQHKQMLDRHAAHNRKIYESPDGGKTVFERDFEAPISTRKQVSVPLDQGAYKNLGNVELDPDDRNWEYDGDGSKIYKPEMGFGTKTPIDLGDLSRIDYKYNENQLIAEFKEYVDETYGLHYSKEKFQATEFIMDGGHGTGFCIGNVLKYAQRYGKKGTRDDARKDLMKVLHYALLQLYVHDSEDKK